MNRRHILYCMFYDMRKQTHRAFFSDDRRAAAVISPGMPLWIYPGEHLDGNEERLFFYTVLSKIKPPLNGIVAPKRTAEICAEVYISAYGGQYGSKEIIAYYLPGKPRQGKTANGKLRAAASGDASFLTGWLEAFYAETFDMPLTFGTRPTLPSLAKPTGNKLYIWEDGQPSSMGMLCGGENAAVRLNLIFTPKELRRKGYGFAAARGLAEKAIERGKIPMLYTGAGNAAANALYQSIGFKEAGRLTEIIFR